MAGTPGLSVCIVTYERPEFLARCLHSLRDALSADTEIVVVDASRVGHRDVAQSIDPSVVYVHAPHLAGWMTRSRNEALKWARGDIVSFLDDDVVVRPGWEAGVRAAFSDASVAAVAGRTCNGVAGEEHYDRAIGRLLPDGTLTDGFASIPDRRDIDVDHGIGANMSFRRAVLALLGGFRDDYPGTALREDTDIFLRIRAIGARAVFAPDAAVDHRPAPHVRGARFDTRYKLYGRRNHMVLLARADGIGSPMLRRWMLRQVRSIAAVPGVAAKFRRLGVTVIGLVWGLAALPRAARWQPLPPERDDATGRDIRGLLNSRAGSGDP